MASLNYGGRDSVVLDYVRNGSLGGYTAQLPSRSYGGWRGACGFLTFASEGCWPTPREVTGAGLVRPIATWSAYR